MPDTFGPFDTVTWMQAGWYRDAYARTLSGVFGTSFAAPGSGDLALTVAGLTVSMGLGRANVRGAGYERTGTAWSFPVPANTATNPRIDRLVLRRDLVAKTVTPLVLQGTAAASPVSPALTQSDDPAVSSGQWDLPLFSWTTPANSGAPLTSVVDERVSADVGSLGGGDSGWATVGVSGAYTANGAPAVRKVGKVVEPNAGITNTGLAINSSYTNVMQIPAGFRPQRNKYGWAATSTPATIGRFVINTDGTVDLSTGATLSTYYRLDPLTWIV